MSKGYVEKKRACNAFPDDVLESLQARVAAEIGPVVVRETSVETPAGPLKVRIQCTDNSGGNILRGKLVSVSRFVFDGEPYDVCSVLPFGEKNEKRVRTCPLESILNIYVAKGDGISGGTNYVQIYDRV